MSYTDHRKSKQCFKCKTDFVATSTNVLQDSWKLFDSDQIVAASHNEIPASASVMKDSCKLFNGIFTAQLPCHD